MTDQFDMFAGPLPPAATPVRRPPPPELLPRRPIAWERLLAEATSIDVTILVSTSPAGPVVETLSDPVLGRKFLHQDGVVHDAAPDTVFGRTIFMTAEQASGLHRRWPLIRLGRPGTRAARFELAPTPDPVETDTMAVLAQLEEVAN